MGLISGDGTGELLGRALAKCTKLRKLWLFRNPELFENDPNGSSAFCEALGSLSNIEVIDLENVGLSGDRASVVEAVSASLQQGLPKLRKLELRNNNFDDGAKQRIREIAKKHGEKGKKLQVSF
mmetsp:Transcript_40237/g.60794  ORF Transcript_40237/g.60794 Transcript_40237/m.60794 type:complete len:124 (-) Transcript_40237:122-493(-)